MHIMTVLICHCSPGGTITKLDTHLEDLYHATKARNDAKRHDDEKSASQKDQNNYAPIQKEIPVDPVHLKLNVRQALEEVRLLFNMTTSRPSVAIVLIY